MSIDMLVRPMPVGQLITSSTNRARLCVNYFQTLKARQQTFVHDGFGKCLRTLPRTSCNRHWAQPWAQIISIGSVIVAHCSYSACVPEIWCDCQRRCASALWLRTFSGRADECQASERRSSILKVEEHQGFRIRKTMPPCDLPFKWSP